MWRTSRTLRYAISAFYRLRSRMQRSGWYMWCALPVFRFKSHLRFVRAKNKRLWSEQDYLYRPLRNTYRDRHST